MIHGGVSVPPCGEIKKQHLEMLPEQEHQKVILTSLIIYIGVYLVKH